MRQNASFSSCIMTVVVLTAFLLSLQSCDHKELCYDHDHAVGISIKFDWRYSPEANPTSMYMYFFPVGGDYKTLAREFRGKNGGGVELIINRTYDALCFNSNLKNIVFRNIASRETVEAYTKNATTIPNTGISTATLPRADGTSSERMAMECDSLWAAGSKSGITLSLGDVVKEYVLYPQRRFCSYSVKILNVKNSDKVSSSMGATLSGLAGGVTLLDGQRNSEIVTVPFAVNLNGKDGIIEGHFNCFGCSADTDVLIRLIIYTKLTDETKWYYVYDVTSQVREAADPYNVEIVLSELPVPDIINGGSGFNPDVNGWNRVDITVNM